MSTDRDAMDKRTDSAEAHGALQERAVEGARALAPLNEGFTDEPPIIIGNGSLFIDLPPDKDIVLDNTSPPDARLPRPFKYVRKSGEPLRAIGRIQVLTLSGRDTGPPVMWLDHDRIDEGLNCQLHIWLAQQVLASDDVFEPVNQSDPTIPQIVIRGNPLSIEVDKELSVRLDTFKHHSPFRYKHPGYTPKQFRIIRWLLFGITPSGIPQIIEAQEGDEDYRLHVSFWHEEGRA